MSNPVSKSLAVRPLTAHSVSDKISEERRCFLNKSLNASLGQELRQAGGHPSEYYDIPNDPNHDGVESSAPSKETYGYSSKNLFDCQAELQYSSPQGSAAQPNYYSGIKEEDEEKDKEANQEHPDNDRSTLIMTSDEALEAMTKESRLATAAQMKALNATEESKHKKEWETMWQTNQGTWMSSNFMEGLGGLYVPLQDIIEHSIQHSNIQALALAEAQPQAPAQVNLPKHLAPRPHSNIQALGLAEAQSQAPAQVNLPKHLAPRPPSNIQALGLAQPQPQASAQVNIPRHLAPRPATFRDTIYSYDNSLLGGASSSCNKPPSPHPPVFLDNISSPDYLGNLLDLTDGQMLDVAVPPRALITQLAAGAAKRGSRRHSSSAQLQDPLIAFNRPSTNPGNDPAARYESHPRLSSTPELTSYDHVESTQVDPIIANLSDPLDILGGVVDLPSAPMSADSTFAIDANSASRKSAFASRAPSASLLPDSFIAVDANSASRKPIFASRSPSATLPADYPRAVGVDANSASRKPAFASRAPSTRLSFDYPTPVDANSASRKPTLASRFAGKLRLLTGHMTNDRSCSVAPEPNPPLYPHSPSPPATKADRLRGFTSTTTGSSPIGRRRYIVMSLPSPRLNGLTATTGGALSSP
eukprot:gene28297-31407_t